jgi:hypothetical protein
VSHRGRRPSGWRRVVPGCVLVMLAGCSRLRIGRAEGRRYGHPGHLRRRGGWFGLDRDRPGADRLQPQHGHRGHPGRPPGAERRAARAPLLSTTSVTASYDNPALIVQAELQSTKPETVVYTINPKAVWSDGVPITAADFIYAWQHQRVGAVGVTGDADVASTAGYEDIASMTRVQPRPHGHRRLLDRLRRLARAVQRPAPGPCPRPGRLEPACSTVDPRIDLSGGPYEIASVRPTITLVKNPKWWGQAPKLDRIVIKVASRARTAGRVAVQGGGRRERPDLLRPWLLGVGRRHAVREDRGQHLDHLPRARVLDAGPVTGDRWCATGSPMRSTARS